jgi:hypothetical protein
MNTLLATVENMIKVAAALAVLGFMSLRSHCNFIGIPATVVYDIPTYLTETYLLTAHIILRVVSLGFVLGVLLLPVLAVTWLLRNTAAWQSIRAYERRVTVWLATHPFGASIGLVALTAGLITLSLSLREPWDVAVGTLAEAKLRYIDWHFDAAIVGVILVSAWYFRAVRLTVQHGQVVPAPVRVAAITVIVIGTALIPVLHGHGARPVRFPIGVVQTKDSTETCGLLVTSSDKDFVLWTVERRDKAILGSMNLYPRDEIRRVEHGGMVDLLEVSNQMLQSKPSALSYCGL